MTIHAAVAGGGGTDEPEDMFWTTPELAEGEAAAHLPPPPAPAR